MSCHVASAGESAISKLHPRLSINFPSARRNLRLSCRGSTLQRILGRGPVLSDYGSHGVCRRLLRDCDTGHKALCPVSKTINLRNYTLARVGGRIYFACVTDIILHNEIFILGKRHLRHSRGTRYLATIFIFEALNSLHFLCCNNGARRLVRLST